MKNKNLICLMALSLSSLCMISCKQYSVDDGSNIPPQDDPNIDDNQNDANGNGGGKPAPVLDFNAFRENILDSKPTKVQSYVSYYAQDFDVVLNYTSLLKIEYAPLIEAEYIYSYQKLNPAGSDQMISTYSGVCYSKGNMFGEFNGETIDWNINVESPIALLNFNFVKDAFTSYDIEGGIFRSSDVNLDKLFGDSIDSSSMLPTKLEVGLGKSYENILYTTLEYRDTNTNAKVSLNSNYYYDYIDVVVPEI